MPNKFYLRTDATTVGGTLPATNVGVATTQPTTIGTGGGTNRQAISAIGATPQVVAANNTLAQTTPAQTILIARFISLPLAAQTISGTADYSIGASEGNAASNFQPDVRIFVWRPSTGALIGTLVNTFAPNTEAGTSQGVITNSVGMVNVTCQDGDVLIIEVWRDVVAQSMASSYANSFMYDGATEASTTDIASFVNFSNNIALQGPSAPTSAPTVAAGTEKVTVTTPATLEGGATSYNIYRGGTQIATGRGANSAFDDVNASVVAAQTYTVRGVDANGVSNNSPASSSVVANPAPPAFVLNPGSGQVSVFISPLRNYDAKYRIYRGLSGGARSLIHTSATLLVGVDSDYTFVDTGRTDGTVYDYHVTTYPQTPTARESAASAVQSATAGLIKLLPLSVDSNVGPWTVVNGTDLIAALRDYAETDAGPQDSGSNGEVLRVLLDPLGALTPISPPTLRWRGSTTADFGATTITIKLQQGTTLIHQTTWFNDNLYANGSFTLTQAEMDSITNWDDLHVEMSVAASSTDTGYITYLYLEVPTGAGGPATLQGAATLTQSSTLSAAPVVTRLPVVNLSQTSSLSAAPIRTALGTAPLTQDSVLSTTAVRIRIADVTLSQTNSIVVSAVPTRVASATLSQTNSIVVSALRIAVAGATFSQTSVLVAAPSGSTVQAATATLTNNQTFSITAERIQIASATMTNSQALTVSGLRIVVPTVTMSQSSVLAVSALRTQPASATLSNTNVIVAVVSGAAGATATLQQSSVVSATWAVISPAVAALTQSNIMVVSGVPSRIATATLVNTNVLTTSPDRVAVAAATMTNNSVMVVSAGGITVVAANATFTNTNVVSVGAVRVVLPAVTMVAGTSAMVVSGTYTKQGAVTLTNTNLLSLSAVHVWTVGPVTLSNNSVMQLAIGATSALAQSSVLLLAPERLAMPIVILTQTSLLLATPARQKEAAITLINNSLTVVAAIKMPQGAVVFTQMSVMLVSAWQTLKAAITFAQPSVLSVQAIAEAFYENIPTPTTATLFASTATGALGTGLPSSTLVGTGATATLDSASGTAEVVP